MKKIVIIFIATISLKAFAMENLSNGLSFESIHDDSLPRQVILLTFNKGTSDFNRDKQGVTAVANRLLELGPKNMNIETFKKQLFLSNSSVEFMTFPTYSAVKVKAPKEGIGNVLNLAIETIRNPRLDDKNYSQQKQAVLSLRSRLADDLRATVFYFGRRDAFHFAPSTLDGTGTTRSIKSLEKRNVSDAINEVYDFKSVSFSTIGPVSSSEMKTIAEKIPLSTSHETEKIKQIIIKDFQRKTRKTTIIHKKGVTDNQIYFVFPQNFKRGSKEYAAGLMAHEILGGGGGKLFSTLRGERGLTYYAGSKIDDEGEFWAVWTFGGIKQTQGLLTGVPEVIKEFKRQAISDDDIENVRQKKILEYKSMLELSTDKFRLRIHGRRLGWGEDYVVKTLNWLKSVNRSDIEKFIKHDIDGSGGYLYLVGDKKNLLDSLKSAKVSTKDLRILNIDDI